MLEVLKVASYIHQRYLSEYGERIEEMKLHKLLYFTQRECIVQMGEPMFAEKFKAWRYGPALLSIRQLYENDTLNLRLSDEAVSKYKLVFDKVLNHYARKSSWSLSTLSRGELSWKQARSGYLPQEVCDVDMQLSDIYKDAERIKLRRFLLSKYKEFQKARA